MIEYLNTVTNPDAHRLPVLAKANAHVGTLYAWTGGWIKLTRVYRLTEQEANENALLCLDRFEGIDRNGYKLCGALPDGDQLKDTSGWKL